MKVFYSLMIGVLLLVFGGCAGAGKIENQVENTALETQNTQENDSDLVDNQFSNYNSLENSEALAQEADEVSVDTLIESKINSSGVLTLTEDEFSEEIASRAIERRIPFSITHLNDRDEMIKTMKKILKANKQSYRVVKEKKEGILDAIWSVFNGHLIGGAVATAAGTALPYVGAAAAGAAATAAAPIVAGAGAAIGFGLVAKDYIVGWFAGKPDWLISKSPDEKVLNILFVKDQN